MPQGEAIKVGCCGFAVSQQEYFRLFPLVEIQQTFYQLPRLETAYRWKAAAPPGFTFTMKAWQLITHEPTSPTYRRLREKHLLTAPDRYGSFRSTAEVTTAWQRTAQFARALGAALVVFQCPASFRPTATNVAQMRAFFPRIDRQGLRLAWEPRGAWPATLVMQLCQELALVHCVDPFRTAPQYGEVQYFRLHGTAGYASRYTDAELRTLLQWSKTKPTYVLFNNQWMKDDALRFMQLLRTETSTDSEQRQ